MLLAVALAGAGCAPQGDASGGDVKTDDGGRCPAGMAFVPAGAARIGGHDNETALDEQTVDLRAFCMDRYEAPGVVGERPYTALTWAKAATRCADRGARLCFEEEWEAACRGPDDLAWSYGPEEEEGRCDAGMEFPPEGTFSVVGSHPDCHNAAGIHDLVGGASEWTASVERCPPFPLGTALSDQPCHVLRGGTQWRSSYGDSCQSRHWHGPMAKHADDGYRCCVDPAADP